MEASFKKSSGNPSAVNSTFINNGIAYSHVNIGFNKNFITDRSTTKNNNAAD